MISIAEAKSKLPALIHQVEAGEAVTISRRGKPVAVVISVAEYERVRGVATSWVDRLDAWRASLPADFEGLTAAELEAVRDREPYMPRLDFSTEEYADFDNVGVQHAAEPNVALQPERRRGSEA